MNVSSRRIDTRTYLLRVAQSGGSRIRDDMGESKENAGKGQFRAEGLLIHKTPCR